MPKRLYDLVIFGASGFTGEFIEKEWARIEKKGLKWAIAGRSASKLECNCQLIMCQLLVIHVNR
jgi:short subunit dehydrogenase-like uncharacterized protein